MGNIGAVQAHFEVLPVEVERLGAAVRVDVSVEVPVEVSVELPVAAEPIEERAAADERAEALR